MVNKLKFYAILTLMVIGFVFLGGCAEKNSEASSPVQENSSEGTPAEEATATEAQEISLKGSDTVLPLAQTEAEEFMIENPEQSVTVTGGGSGVGIAALIDGEVDIATASREMKADEIKAAQANGINPTEHTIAYDGISVVVNPSNPVTELTFDQLRGIYNGSISNWKDIGGTDAPITIISRDSSSGTYEYFQEAVLLEDEYRPDALTQAATGGIVGEVSQNPSAIGYIGVAYLDESVKALNLDAGNGPEAPTPENILSGAYPLSRPLYFYTNGEPTGLTKEFVDFVMSEKGQNLVSEVGYFPIQK
ncbi:PstS family phosphate ABC transporter substrate-binding protein [Methanosarcina sp.]|uniref:PstS family phosphate ABC transporter substrate-binding protein n=1 Tax=Methanosarcina sp. TaxID=2213 RepID=UPI003C788083